MRLDEGEGSQSRMDEGMDGRLHGAAMELYTIILCRLSFGVAVGE
jgi:hypothetical protein